MESVPLLSRIVDIYREAIKKIASPRNILKLGNECNKGRREHPPYDEKGRYVIFIWNKKMWNWKPE